MKLLSELITLNDSLNDEKFEVLSADTVWKEGQDAAKTFVSATTYMVRAEDDDNGTKWHVYSESHGKRKMVATYDTSELEELYVPVRSSDKPDAEGFVLYRDNLEVQAFKYVGNTVELDTGEKLRTGDYLVKEENEEDFVYVVQDSKYFETDFIEKK